MPVPEKIDRFIILEKIAEGAMGIIYKARDPELNDTVAIKVIQFYPGMDDYKREEYRKRFKREAQAARRLKHPNIVTIYDVNEYRSSPYIVMEYIDGISLDDIRKREWTIPLDRAIKYGKQLADALDYAHTRGVIHRDVKPSNILIDRNDNVRVVDFGIAKLVDSDLTQPYQILGSPSYMSPEQIMGGKIDGRSDVFSTGIVFYYILTGRKPFEADNISLIIQKILNDTPEPPSKVNPSLPQQVDYAILKALSKDPEERYDTVMEFINALMSTEAVKEDTKVESLSDLFKKLLTRMNFNVNRMEENNNMEFFAYAEQRDPLLKGKYFFRIILKPPEMKVGISVLREVFLEIQDKRFTKAFVISNTDFTDEGYEFVAEKPMELINGKMLEELFQKHLPTGSYELKQRLPVRSVMVGQSPQKIEEETTHDVTPSDRIFMSKTQESRRLIHSEKGGFLKNLWRKK
jgi:serine/threonine protein kinase